MTTSVIARALGSVPVWSARRRLIVLLPLLLLAASVMLVARNGDTLIERLGHNPPPADQFLVSRVDFVDNAIRVRVSNPQRDDMTIATVTVDDAVVPFTVDGSRAMGRLDRRAITIPFAWVEDDPYAIGITSSSGIQTVHEVPAAVERAAPSAQGLVAGGILGLLVGVLPVALGLAWLPSLRRASTDWLVAFLALTAGMLTFVALDAFAEALELQTRLPGALSGTGMMLLGIATSYLAISWLAWRTSRRGDGGAAIAAGLAAGADARATAGATAGQLAPFALALLVAVGIGFHNFGEGLAIGSSFALGELTLGIFLVTGFMIHNVTEGLGIAVPAAGGKSLGIVQAGGLALVAGSPAMLGIWIGRYVTSDLLAVLFFSLAVGAAMQVVVEVLRYLRRLDPGRQWQSGWIVGGFLAGLAVMWLTGIMVG